MLHHITYIGAGSNQGGRLAMLAGAARHLCESAGVNDIISSPVYETRAVGNAGPAHFLNAVFQLTVSLPPMQLFLRLQEIELTMGRCPPRDGPRPIDLDLLLYDDLVLENELLVIPHPRLARRAFVLRPLADLAPCVCHPELGLSIGELLAALPVPNEIIKRYADATAIAAVVAGI